MKKIIILLGVCLLAISCSKNDNSLPDPVIESSVGVAADPTYFVFTGNIEVDKYDSNSTPVASYILPNKISTLNGIKPSFVLTNNINGDALKGEVSNSINISITNTSFYTLASGTGVFQNGVSGVYSGDSLKYQILYQDYYKNNIYLNFKGKLTNSY